MEILPYLAPSKAAFDGDWTNFFQATATVSVTLFSVMFITFQVRSGTWHSSRLKRIAAVAALTELLVPLLTALIALMAGHPWRLAACITGGLGLLTVVAHWTIYVRDRHKPYRDRFDKAQAGGSLLSFAAYTTVIVGGSLGHPSGLYIVGVVSILLLCSGAIEAWWLLEPRGVTPPPP